MLVHPPVGSTTAAACDRGDSPNHPIGRPGVYKRQRKCCHPQRYAHLQASRDCVRAMPNHRGASYTRLCLAGDCSIAEPHRRSWTEGRPALSRCDHSKMPVCSHLGTSVERNHVVLHLSLATESLLFLRPGLSARLHCWSCWHCCCSAAP